MIREVLRRGVLAIQAIQASEVLGSLHPTKVASFLFDSLGKGSNPSMILRFHSYNSPDKVALIQGDTQITYGQLEERVNRLATVLVGMGIGKGDRVAIMMRNCHEYLETQWAITRVGATAVQIGYRLKTPEVAYILGNSQPKLMVYEKVDDETVQAAVAQAGLPARDRVVHTGAPFEALLARGEPKKRPKIDKGAKGAIMIYTSGTTGRPKGAQRGLDKALHESVTDFLRLVKISHNDKQLVVCPLYHSAAPVFVAFGLAFGSTMVLEGHFDPEQALATIARERITGAFMVPTMLGRMATLPKEIRAKYDVSCLRWLCSGAAPLPTETARQIEEAFGQILFNFYGATETGMVTMALPGEHTSHPATIGRALSGNEIRLYGENGQVVGPGGVGELYVRNSMLVSGYHADRASTDKAMRDGFFSVGDMARVDAEGFYYLADRKIDMVISGGVNIYPLEIEERIFEHPAVLECAVIGVPDADWGESLKAFVVLREGMTLTADEVRAFCKQTLANYKCPKHVAFLDALPRTPTGKVLKRELRKS